MHHHSRRLIDEKKVVIFIKNIERNIFRAGFTGFAFMQIKVDDFPGFDAVVRGNFFPADKDAAVFNRFF